EYVFEALRVGASGFLIKDTKPAELVRAVRLVSAGDALLSPSITRRVLSELARRPSRPVRPHPQAELLTDREREVVALVAEGLSTEEIGGGWPTSRAPARPHVSRAILKLGGRDRAQLVAFAYRSGLAGCPAAPPLRCLPGTVRPPA